MMPGEDDRPDASVYQENEAARDAYAAGRDVNITNNYFQDSQVSPEDLSVAGLAPGDLVAGDSRSTAPAPGPLGPIDRWTRTSDGFKVPALMRLTHGGVSHPGYMSRQPQDEPPSVKMSMLVPCRPIDPSGSGSEMRAKFVAFLSSAPVRELTGALTDVSPVASWKSLVGNGRRTLEAALTFSDYPMEGVPVAYARFLPPVAGESLYGRDSQAATLILYVEPSTREGRLPPPSDLATWHHRFALALAAPGHFADFLAEELGLSGPGVPSPQLGIWLESRQRPLTTMVDTQGLRTLPGAWPSNQFIGWAFATPDGGTIADTARDLLTHLCEDELHLDGFE
jgi:hypothetical protein